MLPILKGSRGNKCLRSNRQLIYRYSSLSIGAIEGAISLADESFFFKKQTTKVIWSATSTDHWSLMKRRQCGESRIICLLISSVGLFKIIISNNRIQKSKGQWTVLEHKI